MRQLVANTFLTLDGVMQGPGAPQEDPTGGFTQGGWIVNYWDDLMGQRMDRFMGKPFDVLLGRRTYEIFAAHWPHVDESQDTIAKALNAARKYVASRTLDNVEWKNSTLLIGDAAEAVAKLKEQSGPEIQVHGSSNLLQTLIRHGLVDVYQLWTFPVVIGRGKRLFADGAVPSGLKLLDSQTSSTGVVIATYAPAGSIPLGSFALETPTDAELERRRKLAGE